MISRQDYSYPLSENTVSVKCQTHIGDTLTHCPNFLFDVLNRAHMTEIRVRGENMKSLFSSLIEKQRRKGEMKILNYIELK